MEDINLPATLVEAAIPSLPATAYYIPNFITFTEEEILLDKINSAPLPTWRHLSHRRLQTYPSPLTPQNTLLASPLPAWLSEPVIPRLLSLPIVADAESGNVFSDSPHRAPNHVLINEYSPGQGIFPHEDGSAYHPVVATISLGSHIVLNIYAKKDNGSGEREAEPRWRILQEPRSLLITTGELYRDHLHGIAETEVDEDLNPMGVVNWNLMGTKEDFNGGKRRRDTRGLIKSLVPPPYQQTALPTTTAQHEVESETQGNVLVMNDVPTSAPDTNGVQGSNIEVASDTNSPDVGPLTGDSRAANVNGGTDILKDVAEEQNNGDQRSDSEAETVVLSGKDQSPNHVNPRAIKHEGTNDMETAAVQNPPRRSQENTTQTIKHDNSILDALDRRKGLKDTSATAITDASYSSNLSSNTSSPAGEGRSPSIARSEPERAGLDPPSIPGRKRKLRSDDSDEKAQQRRLKRVTTSETVSHSEHRSLRKASDTRSESPPTRTRKRAQSTQSGEQLVSQKRRKPPPLLVNQRARVTEEPHTVFDDGGSANNPAHLLRLVSTDNLAMSPAKTPHKKHRSTHGLTYLAQAAQGDDLNLFIERLRDYPEDLDDPDFAGNTPLQIASLKGNAAVVKMLLDAGCDITCKNIDLDTPLIDACENERLAVVRLLLEAGMDPQQGNARGEEPLDLLDPSSEVYEDMKGALTEAKNRFVGRTTSEDQQGQSRARSDSLPLRSPRASPSLPPLAQPLRRTARSEATRNDLLYIGATAENLRKYAGKGDSTAVAHILQMGVKGDPEAVLIAAKGGHETCLGVLIAMIGNELDPDPLPSNRYKQGYNTPMLAAIGRNNLGIIKLLLAQTGFDPTRRPYRNLTYFEVAKDRQGVNWKEEYDLLKAVYDKYMKGNTDPKTTSGTSQRHVKNSKKEHSFASRSNSDIPQSPESASKILHAVKSRHPKAGHLKSRQDEGIEGPGQEISIDRLHAPSRQNEKESSVVLSDRELVPLQQKKEKTRSLSDAGPSHPKNKETSKPKRKLVTGKVFKEEAENKRRVSLASSASSHEDLRSKVIGVRSPVDSEKGSTRETAKSSSSEAALKRREKNSSPSDRNNSKLHGSLDAMHKGQRKTSPDSKKDRNSPGPVQLGPAEVANMIASSSMSESPIKTQGAAPVAFMGNSSISPIQEAPNLSAFPLATMSPKGLESTPAVGILPQDTSNEDEAEEMQTTRDVTTLDLPSLNKQIPGNIETKHEEQQLREQELAALEAQEKFAKEEIDRIAREAEEHRLREQRQAEEAERKLQIAREVEQRRIEELEQKAKLEREAEQAQVERKQQEEEAHKRQVEKERLRKEDMERRHLEQEERERLSRIRRQEEEERRRRESLPNALRMLAEFSSEEAKTPFELQRWLPLYTAFGHQIIPQCDQQAREERWIVNLQVAALLAISDLSLSQYTAWTKRYLNENERINVWCAVRNKLTRYNPPRSQHNLFVEADQDKITRSKYFALEHVFWIRLSDFLDIAPRYKHLANVTLRYQRLALVDRRGKDMRDDKPNILQTNGAGLNLNGGVPSPPFSGQLINGYH
ncbi:Set3 complex subunit with deacetylase activity, meiotic-specific repressor of sporulation proteins [Xylographa bjoerkii]|nr:Set3 complex subunit with deacetylase activity, meiotic-specific repressor of sporulation proteins [Xylographa bjoerkii]